LTRRSQGDSQATPADGRHDSTALSVMIGRTRVSVVVRDDCSTFLQWDELPATPPFVDDQVNGVYASNDKAVLAGRLPRGATTVEVVAPDGVRVQGDVVAGAWLAVVPDNQRGIDAYPVLFRAADGSPVPRHLPTDWDRRPSSRGDRCPACLASEWDLVTAGWEGQGSLRSTRWGHHDDLPGQAYVCRVCGYAHPIGARWQY